LSYLGDPFSILKNIAIYPIMLHNILKISTGECVLRILIRIRF
jgi:hypothetical protein